MKKVFEKEKIKSCLETIFEFNVIKYGDAKLGAVNGMRPNGQVDITSMQSEGKVFLVVSMQTFEYTFNNFNFIHKEMWIGVTDSLASLMIYEVFIYLFTFYYFKFNFKKLQPKRI